MRSASRLGSIFVATAVLMTASAATHGDEMLTVGDSRLGIHTAPILLLSRADVQADLRLSSQQISDAQQVSIALRRRALTTVQKDPHSVEAERRQIEHEMTEWLKSHLSPEQSDRLHQIDLQWEGISAVVRRPIVAEYLRLDESQKTSLQSVLSNHIKARGGQRPTLVSHEALNRQGLAVLSEAQRLQWQRLLGSPCHFAISGRPVDGANATNALGAATPAAPQINR